MNNDRAATGAGIGKLLAARSFAGRRMLLLAFLGQSCSVGVLGASFGPLTRAWEQRLDLGRGEVATGLAAALMALGLLSPFAGAIVKRLELRRMMMLGAALCASAYLLLSITDSYALFLLLYGVCGAGLCLLGIISPATLISRWYAADRGAAMGLANVPLFMVITSPVVAWIETHYGMRGAYLMLGGLLLLQIPAMHFVVERPEDIGQRPWGAKPGGDASAATRQPEPYPFRVLARMWSFWLLTIPVAILTAMGNVFMVHGVPLALGYGFTLQAASLLVSAFAASGLVGTLLLGWLADRIGAVMTLALISFGLALAWVGLVHGSAYTLLLLLSAALGALTTAVVPVHGAAINELFGSESVAGVLGISYFIKMPFLFTLPPLAGYLFDAAGNYRLPFTLGAVALLMAGLSLILATRPRTR